jgi:protein SCO1/2
MRQKMDVFLAGTEPIYVINLKMKKFNLLKKNNLFLLLFLIVIGCKENIKTQEGSRIDALPFFNEASFTPKWISSKSAGLKNFHKIPDFE